jgi:hypothetical protein
MEAQMLTRNQVWMIVALALAVSLTWIWLGGEEPTPRALAAKLSSVVAIVYTILLVFSKYAWSLMIFRGWLVNRPDLRGSWQVTLKSDWLDPSTKQRATPIEGYAVIRQTLSTLSMRVFTMKSRSVLVAHSIEPEPDGLFNLSAVYRNFPRIEYQGIGSAIHHGALLIDIHVISPRQLEGHYWTDRGTRGTIELVHKSSKHYSSFEEAKNAIGHPQ